MAEAATIEERLARVEGRLEEQSRYLANPATKDDIMRLEARIDRLFYLILGSWITLAIFIGGLYIR